MNIGIFRKQVPVIPHFKRITRSDLNTVQKATQEFCDCYLVSSIEALSNSKEGRKILYNNIRKSVKNSVPSNIKKDVMTVKEKLDLGLYDNNPVFKITFNKVNSKKESFVIGRKESNKYSEIYYKQKNHLLFAIKVAMQKLVTKHPFKKPLYSRLINPFIYNFEYNRPSSFMEMFTGKKPLVIAESDININLRNHKKEVLELLKNLSLVKNSDYSFIAGTGVKSSLGISSWHCVVIKNVDFENRIVNIKNKRANGVFVVSFDEFLSKFKYIVGYFNKDLKA